MYKLLTVIFCILIGVQCKSTIKESPKGNAITDSISYYDDLIHRFPNEDTLYFRRGIYLINNNQLDSGLIDLQKAILLNRKKPSYSYSLSDAYLLAINSKKAEEVLDSALYYNPNDLRTMLKIIRLQIIVKKYMQAMARLDQVFQLDPSNVEAFYLAGHLFYEQEDTGRAVNSYQKAVDLNPEFVEGWIQLGDIMTTMRNPLAIQYYKNAIRLDSNNIETLHNYAYSLQIFGKEQEAINQYLINIQKRPDYELSLYNLGIMYQKKDSCEQAIDYLSRAIALNSKEASSFYYRARCYTKINQADKASEDLKTALNLYPEYYEARKMLSELRK